MSCLLVTLLSAVAPQALHHGNEVVPQPPPAATKTAIPGPPTPSLVLVENAGQWESEARFHGRLGNVSVALLPGALQFQLARLDLQRGVAMRLQLEGSDPARMPRGENLRPETRSYFGASDTPGIAARSYGSALYEDLLPGVDLRLRDGGGRFEWDLLVDPDVDASHLIMRCDGISDLAVDPCGDLILETELGEVRMPPPVSWTVNDEGQQEPVETTYVRVDRNRFRFHVPSRDARLPLVIDPGVDWIGFVGGSNNDACIRSAITASGNVVAAGITNSPDFQVSVGAFQTSPSSFDGFVSVFDPTGATLLHSTYLGGAGIDSISGLDLDAAGRIVVAGQTDSADFPTTPGAYKTAKGLGVDSFVSVLSSDLTTLEYSTFIGDASFGGNDLASDVAIGATGEITVCGTTRSPSFIVTPGALQTTFGGDADVFVVRIDPGGNGTSDLVWSSFLGGAGQESQGSLSPFSGNSLRSPDLILDASGAVTITGTTESSDFPTTPGAFNEGPLAFRDAFVSRISADGSALDFSTLIGGNEREIALASLVDDNGRIFVAGITRSTDFVTTPGAFQTSLGGPAINDGFVCILSPDASTLEYGTYLGGSELDVTNSIDLNPDGLIVVAGRTESDNFPVTAGAKQGQRADASDVFISVLDPGRSGAAQLRYGTFFGGSGDDLPWELHVVDPSVVVIVGETDSVDLPVTAGTVNPTIGGAFDGYVGTIDLRSIGERYCSPNAANSTGEPSRICTDASAFIDDMDVTLLASGLPVGVFGIFIASQNRGVTPSPGGSPGTLCLGGSLARFVGPGEVRLSDAAGAFSLAIDPTALPLGTGFVSALPGETWHFQAWHRDVVGGAASSNFTDAISLTFE